MERDAPRAGVGVPFIDLRPTARAVATDALDAIAAAAAGGAFTGGPAVSRFEEAFAAYCGARTCVGVASGLDALRLALLGSGIGAGDEVVVPAMTFVATLEAVSQTGATPVVVDVTDADYCIDLEAAAAGVSGRTRCLLPVHLYGQLADMRAIGELALAHDLFVLEDACQAHGAERDGIRAGTGGDAAAFSFYPTKNLGAWGDAGAVVTDNDALAATVRALREHGQRAPGEHELIGYTSRLDPVQAVVLMLKLPLLADWQTERRRAADAYDTLLNGIGDLRLPPRADGGDSAWHLYVVRTQHRDALRESLALRGIATSIHYPEPVHLSSAYASLGHVPGAFPVAEALAREAVSLPFFVGITAAQQEAVAVAVREFFAG